LRKADLTILLRQFFFFQVKEDQFSFPFKKIENAETKNLIDICSALKSGNYSRMDDVLLDLKQLFRVRNKTDRKSERQKDRPTERQKDIRKDIKTERQKDRKTERQKDRKIERQTDRKIER
jgi:hypothetical protein